MDIRVLVVDDHAVARQVMRSILERSKGVEVAGVAGGGEEALSAIKALQPDVVVLDMLMPGVDGFGVLDALEAEAERPKVVMFSIEDGPEAERKAMANGASAFVAKMSAHEELLETIRTVMAG